MVGAGKATCIVNRIRGEICPDLLYDEPLPGSYFNFQISENAQKRGIKNIDAFFANVDQ